MKAAEVARALTEFATLLELNGENAFRVRAFTNAARVLESTDVDLEELARENRLTELSGIGEGISGIIGELVRTGSFDSLDEVRATTPAGLHELLRIPGLGAKRIHTLHAQLDVDSLDALEGAARAGRVAEVSGFGAKTEQKILDGISFVRASRGQRRFPSAMQSAVALIEWLRAQPGVQAAEIVGALRRRMETVDEIVLVAAADEPQPVLRAFADFNSAPAEHPAPDADVTDTVRIRLSDGLAARLRCVPPDRFVAAVLWETGNEEHLCALAERAASWGMRLDPNGLWRGDRLVSLPQESALYAALELEYVPPELREGQGEVDAAAVDRIPRLIELSDLRGTFHCHTTYSDGRATVAEMAEAARARGWSYLGLADHSRAAVYAGGLSPAAVRKQHREIDEWNRQATEHAQHANNEEYGGTGAERFRIFKGTEADILPDGTLDYPDELLATFDYVVGSVHSSFGMSEREMTERVIRAVRNPHLTMLGHPTGRLLLGRDAYAIDLRAVIDAAAESGAAIEINADPHRLDLDWRMIGYAAERGVPIPINPDAHSTAGLDNVAYGVNVARKGGLTAAQVLNTWTLLEVETYFAQRKQASEARADI